jgi:serine O-acetyltransferase
MYPNTAIIGRSLVRAGSVMTQGTSVINQDTPGESIVFGAGAGRLTFKPLRTPVLGEFFRA